MRKLLSIFAVLILVGDYSFAVQTQTKVERSGPVAGRFIVRLSSSSDPNLLSKSLGDAAMTRIFRSETKSPLRTANSLDRYFVLALKDTLATSADVMAMFDKGVVESVEPDYYLQFFDYPTDSLFIHQWYLNNTGQSYYAINRIEGLFNDTLTLKSGVAGKDIGLSDLYEQAPAETTRVVVAIVDSGVDPTHPELAGRFWVNPDEIPGNNIDDDHNGFVDDTLGYDISGDEFSLFDQTGDNDPTDEHGHGTHIAGIVASSANGVGIAGVAPMAEIMPVKIRPNGTAAVGAAGIVYAVDAGAQVINISWGTPFESGILRTAINYARQQGVFVAIAPGNTGSSQRFYPAAFDSTFVVAAGNSVGQVTTFSTIGSHIDIVAPGLDILSLRAAGTDMYGLAGEPDIRIIGDDSLYYLSDGTSMAAPMVAGAAALLLAIRPDLSLGELESLLLNGADDLIDPYGVGDNLPGPDTISGYGYLNVSASLALATSGGLKVIQPVRRTRLTSPFSILIGTVGAYSGGWQLEYSIGQSNLWQLIAQGSSVPPDAIAISDFNPALSGLVNLRLTDDAGRLFTTSVYYVAGLSARITSPHPGEVLDYSIPIIGVVHGLDFDSLEINVRTSAGLNRLFVSTGEFYDSLMYHWTLSSTDTGMVDILLSGHFASGLVTDSVRVRVSSTFARGWPQTFQGRGGLTAVIADLNHDNIKEIVVPTTAGLYLYHADGRVVDGWPVFANRNVRCVPAIYDVDNDGEDEIIFTSDSGIHVHNYDGTPTDGWPQYCVTGLIPYEYGYPNPAVVQLGQNGDRRDSVIMILNKLGDIRAYHFDGTPYFYSLGGLFGSFNPRVSPTFAFGGQASPFVTTARLMGDSIQVVGGYSSPYPYTGLGLFKARNALPAIDSLRSPLTLRVAQVYGTTLGDFDLDGRPEVVIVGSDTTGMPTIWVKTNGVDDYPGWPIQLPDVQRWISSYPVLADLDLDGIPEIMCTFFEYDVSALYIFRHDGQPYVIRDGRPAGEAFFQMVTFGTPMAANLLGDEYPEIVMRSGYIIPGTGPERLYILDHAAEPVPGWPIVTPARNGTVLSSRFVPLIDDLDGDGKVELILVSDGSQLLVWDFEASYDFGRNRGRFLADNLNSGIFNPAGVATEIGEHQQLLPNSATLSQNFPNPFNPTTSISFSLGKQSHVTIDVYNILGQRVTQLVDKRLGKGNHSVTFDAREFASGIYFYRMTAGETVLTRRMVLLK